MAPFEAEGLDWLAGMGPENVEEFGFALQGEAALRSYLERVGPHRASLGAEEIADALGGLVSPVDKAALTGEFAQYMADSFHAAVSTGIDGWLDDDLAFARPWGFELDELKVPAAIWQGDQDRMVPWAHGVWLAAHVGSSQPHLVMGEGHVSLGVASLDTILGDLRAMAGAPL